MRSLDVPLEADGSWLCQHMDAALQPAPARRLNFEDTVDECPGHPTSAPRRTIRCPDCGRRWRVWVQHRLARPYLTWKLAEIANPPPYGRAPILDIDRVIAAVQEQFPDLQYEQHSQIHPADDDGLWFLWRSADFGQIQLESSDGMCPFLVEYWGMASAAEALHVTTVAEAVAVIVDSLWGEQRDD